MTTPLQAAINNLDAIVSGAKKAKKKAAKKKKPAAKKTKKSAPKKVQTKKKAAKKPPQKKKAAKKTSTSSKQAKAKKRAKSKASVGTVSAALSTADKHQLKILLDTVKNPAKGLLGGPSAEEAEKILREKFGYNDAKIKKLKANVSAARSKYDDPEFAAWIYKWLKADHAKMLKGMQRRGEDPSRYDPAMIFLGSLAIKIEEQFRKDRGMSNSDYFNSEYPKKLKRNLGVAMDKLHGKGTFRQAMQNNKRKRSSAAVVKAFANKPNLRALNKVIQRGLITADEVVLAIEEALILRRMTRRLASDIADRLRDVFGIVDVVDAEPAEEGLGGDWRGRWADTRRGLTSGGRDELIPFIVRIKKQYDGRRVDPVAFPSKRMRPNNANLAKWVEKFNDSLEPGGVNDHLGSGSMILEAELVDQRSGKVLGRYKMRNPPMFVAF